VLPAVFLAHTDMPWRRKLLVVVIFSLRLPWASGRPHLYPANWLSSTVAFIIAYLVASTRFVTSGSVGVGITDTAIWQQVLLSYSLMSVTMLMLRRFVKDFTTGGMGFTMDTHSTTTGSAQNSKPQSTVLQLAAVSKKSAASYPLPGAGAKPTTALRRSRSASQLSEDMVRDFSSVASQSSRQQMIRWGVMATRHGRNAEYGIPVHIEALNLVF
jgi:hypothetical protein